MPNINSRLGEVQSDDYYLYRAALYCKDCGCDIRDSLKMAGTAPADPGNESSYDSNDYPKGPFDQSTGEADSPQHCDRCQVYLDNPLTADGVAYVLKCLTEWILEEEGKPEVMDLWVDHMAFYSLTDSELIPFIAYQRIRALQSELKEKVPGNA